MTQLTHAAVHTLTPSRRISAFDIVRGWAMLLMLISHSTWRIPDFEYRVAFGWDNMIVPDLSVAQSPLGFLLQAVSPIFFLLAGFSLALFLHSRENKGWSSSDITRFMIIRGSVLIALDLTIVNFDLLPQSYGYRVSVLTVIGLSVIAMAFLRHLRLRWLIAIGLVLTFGTQWLYYLQGAPTTSSLLIAVLFSPQLTAPWSVEFSLLPWLPVVLMGYISSRLITKHRVPLKRYTLAASVLLASLWAVVISVNGFGTLYPDDALIFTKHPPDLAYLLIYLSLAFGLLWMHSYFANVSTWWPFRILAILGRSALIFYILHTKILDLSFYVMQDLEVNQFTLSLLITLLALPILVLLCAAYADLRRRYPDSLLRYL